MANRDIANNTASMQADDIFAGEVSHSAAKAMHGEIGANADCEICCGQSQSKERKTEYRGRMSRRWGKHIVPGELLSPELSSPPLRRVAQNGA